MLLVFPCLSSHLLPMELYVPRLCSMPRPHFFLISITAFCASLLPCSVICLDADYEYCQNSSTCGSITFRYPFGVGNHGCGLPGFQINCVDNLRPVITIKGHMYAILGISYDIHSFILFRDENCQFSGAAVIGQEFADSDFGMTSIVNWTLNVYRCITSNLQGAVYFNKRGVIKQCNATVYYSLFQHLIRGCPLEQKTIEVALTQWISQDAKRDQSCVSCQASGGICGYNFLDSTAPFVCYCKHGPRTNNCAQGKNVKSDAVIGVSLGLAVLTVVGLLVCITVHRRRKRRMFSNSFVVSGFTYDEYKDMEAAIQGKIGTLPIFSYKVLKEATNDFDDTKQLGDGGHGSVYLGKLPDGRAVAVKKLYHHNYQRVQQFINEVQILSTSYHPNLVRLYGCTSPKDRELLLVYEYVPNGTLADHLHGGRNEAHNGALNWNTRLRICIEIARALAFLHCLDPPVFHRDVKSSNILLDEDLHVKVGDFGISRFKPVDATHISTAPQGTPGYIDPEYHICFQLTDKSDVYSFGVVLMEIISAKLAVDVNRSKAEIILANMAITKIQAEALHELIDPNLDIDSNPDKIVAAHAVAKLAFKCLSPQREARPNMKEVVAELEQIKQIEVQWKHPPFNPPTPTSVQEKWPSTATIPQNTE